MHGPVDSTSGSMRQTAFPAVCFPVRAGRCKQSGWADPPIRQSADPKEVCLHRSSSGYVFESLGLVRACLELRQRRLRFHATVRDCRIAQVSPAWYSNSQASLESRMGRNSSCRHSWIECMLHYTEAQWAFWEEGKRVERHLVASLGAIVSIDSWRLCGSTCQGRLAVVMPAEALCFFLMPSSKAWPYCAVNFFFFMLHRSRPRGPCGNSKVLTNVDKFAGLACYAEKCGARARGLYVDGQGIMG